MTKLANILFASVLLFCLAFGPASGSSFLDELRARFTNARDPLDKLYLNFALGYVLCSQTFRSAELQGNTPQGAKIFSKAKQCQADMLAEGNAAIEKIKPSFPKPSAQAALKDLTLYWRVQMSEIKIPQSDSVYFAILRNLTTYAERVRLEAEWQ